MRGRKRTKCNKDNRCEIHINGKYLKWNCGNKYSPEERHKIYLKKKINCELCGNSSTQKICRNCFYLVNIHHLKGKKLPKKWRDNIKKGQKIGENNKNWKGENVGYWTKHKGLIKYYGNPKKCEDCGIKGKKNKGGKWTLQWANINSVYTRNIKNYKGLCTKCHSRFDGKTKNIEDLPCGLLLKYRKGCRCELCKKAKYLYRNGLSKYKDISK